MRDPSPIWHPFTQHALAGPAIAVARAEGTTLYTEDGRAILDAISSWWVNTHGHGHPHIARAIAEQATKLEQVIFAGFTHEPAERLARKLVALAGLPHVFFSDFGSTAVEVAIKMAVGCWHHRGAPRPRIIALEYSYHGDMFGAMAVGHRGVFSAAYDDMLFEVSFLPFPEAGAERKTLDALERLVMRERDPFAALIIEPLVLGAGGMKIYAPPLLAQMARICRKAGVFLIADEVMTGFGRTGTMFACEQAGISPDIMCLSKGITGGALPLGATLASEEIFRAFFSDDRAKTFFHSSSFTGNAIACAAAVANLEIWESEPVLARITDIARHHAARLAQITQPGVATRQTGTIAAVEMTVSDAGYLSSLGPKIAAFALERGVLLRPLGNVVYTMPPYCTTHAELEKIHHVIAEAVLFAMDDLAAIR